MKLLYKIIMLCLCLSAGMSSIRGMEDLERRLRADVVQMTDEELRKSVAFLKDAKKPEDILRLAIAREELARRELETVEAEAQKTLGEEKTGIITYPTKTRSRRTGIRIPSKKSLSERKHAVEETKRLEKTPQVAQGVAKPKPPAGGFKLPGLGTIRKPSEARAEARRIASAKSTIPVTISPAKRASIQSPEEQLCLAPREYEQFREPEVLRPIKKEKILYGLEKETPEITSKPARAPKRKSLIIPGTAKQTGSPRFHRRRSSAGETKKELEEKPEEREFTIEELALLKGMEEEAAKIVPGEEKTQEQLEEEAAERAFQEASAQWQPRKSLAARQEEIKEEFRKKRAEKMRRQAEQLAKAKRRVEKLRHKRQERKLKQEGKTTYDIIEAAEQEKRLKQQLEEAEARVHDIEQKRFSEQRRREAIEEELAKTAEEVRKQHSILQKDDLTKALIQLRHDLSMLVSTLY